MGNHGRLRFDQTTITHETAAEEPELELPPEGSRPLSSRSALLALFVAVIGHLPALGTYWNQDDWGLLGRAAGLVTTDGLPARFISQVCYWQFLYPFCGLATVPYAWSRLLLHGGSALLVARIAAHGRLGPAGQMIAGLLFAATPLVFTPLYWASGVQELLGAFFALAAVERWLADGRTNYLWAFLLGSLSILSKENGLGLPLFFTAILVSGAGWHSLRAKRSAWFAITALGVVAVAEAVLIWQHFDHGPGRPYSFGSWFQPLFNLAGYGWWLSSLGPFFSPRPGLIHGLAGGSVWLLWIAAAVLYWSRGRRWIAGCLLGGFLALFPVLPLASHHNPYFLYLTAAAGGLALASLVPGHWRPRPLLIFGMMLLVMMWSWGTMNFRLKARDDQAMPADPLVLRTAISYEAMQKLRALPQLQPEKYPRQLVLLQLQQVGPMADMAERLGENWVRGSLLHTAMGGIYGPRLVLGDSVEVRWVNSLEKSPPHAFVMVEHGPHLRPWGPTPQALLYLTLTLVARSEFARAGRHLLRAALLSDRTMPFFYDPDLMLVSSGAIRLQADRFREYLAQETRLESGRDDENDSGDDPEDYPEGDPENQSTARDSQEDSFQTAAALIAIFDDLVRICCGENRSP